MDKYIKANELVDRVIDSMKNNPHSDSIQKQMHTHEHRYFITMIEAMNGEDVAVVKHGTWKLYEDGSAVCSCCRGTQLNAYDMDTWQNYCGRCGAKMDGVTL